MTQEKNKLVRSKKFWIVIACFIVIAGSGVAAYFLLTSPTPDAAPEEESANIVTSPEKVIVATQKAQTTLEAEGVDAATKVYDEAIAASTDNTEKAGYVSQKSVLYLSEGRYDEALEFALEAESIEADRYTAGTLAEIYLRKENKTEAVRYFNLAKERVKTDKYGVASLNDEAYYQKRIDETNN